MKIEENCLGHLTVSENIKKAYELGLNEKHFSSPANKSIYSFILNYWIESGRETAPTEEVIVHEFPNFKVLEPEETLDWLIGELKTRYKFNGIAEALEKAAELADQGEVDAALKVMAADSLEIIQDTATRKSFANLVENIDDRRARYLERATFDQSVWGAPIGLPEVDQHTYGIFPGEIAVVAGYAGTGKTQFEVMAALAGLKAGFNPYMVSLELSRQDVEDRMDALNAGLNAEKIFRGKLSREEYVTYVVAQDELKSYGSLYVEAPGKDERTVQAIVNKARQRGADYLIIDQLSFIQGRRDYYKTPQDKIKEIMDDIHETIAETNDQKLPVLLAVQFNREQKKSGKAEMWNIADAATIERVAELAFGLNQSNEQRANKAMELALMKFRRGPNERWLLNWDLGENNRISVLDRIGFDV